MALITIGKDKLVYAITAAKLILSLILDTLLVSTLPVSLNLGVNGIGISNIISNLILFIIAVILIYKCGYPLFRKEKLSFTWMKDFFKVLFKEFRVAIMAGLILALVNGARVLIMYGNNSDVINQISISKLAIVSGLSLIGTVVLSKCLGCILPMLAKKCNSNNSSFKNKRFKRSM